MMVHHPMKHLPLTSPGGRRRAERFRRLKAVNFAQGRWSTPVGLLSGGEKLGKTGLTPLVMVRHGSVGGFMVV